MRDFLSYSVLPKTMLEFPRIQSGKMNLANKENTI